MSRPAETRLRVLIVEDNRGDVRLAREAFREIGCPVEVSVAEDGMEALDMLRGANGFPGMEPDIILLDLNMPRLNGHETLAALKGDPVLRRIPVVVFSSSSSEEDVERCYAMHANCYISKPADFVEYVRVLRAIEGFWLEVARLARPTPPTNRRGETP